MTPPKTRRVAVIGAGLSGLAISRELLLHDHNVVIFEKSHTVGGTWVYDPRTETDPIGLDPHRAIVHSSVYRSLRTNLPRPLLGFLDHPFPDPSCCFGDPRAFPSHGEVARFLEEVARESGAVEFVRFGWEVVGVAMGGRKDEWVVEVRDVVEGRKVVEVFEAVVVCTGNYTQPRLADISGIERWPGKQIHSHNYRVPEPFQDKIVVVIGMSASAFDISKELSMVAKEVHLASRSKDIEIGKLDMSDNIWQHSMIEQAFEDGKVVFQCGTSLYPDVILHCTGYKYHFPFLKPNEIVTVEDNRVDPLYKHVFPPHLAPWFSFVGILQKAPVFLSVELQSKWVANVISGKLALPREEQMMASVEELYSRMEQRGKPKHYTHGIYPDEAEYFNWLAAELGLSLEPWIGDMYLACLKSVKSGDQGYRDNWDEEYWFKQINSVN